MPRNAAFATLLTNPSYLPGCLVVHHSLQSVHTRYPFVVMISPDLPEECIDTLHRRGIVTRVVRRLLPVEGTHKLADHDARFGDTWTKLRAFELVQYERIVMMDCDMIVKRNMDELMDLELRPNWIAASHVCACNPRRLPHYPKDWVPENCAYTPLVHPTALISPPVITENSPRPYTQLNSGLFVLNPSLQLAKAVYHFLDTSPLIPTFTFPDQDLLAAFFRGRWKPLPWCYNALKTLRIVHKPLWKDEEIRCLHYILHDKPWHRRVGGKGDQYEVVNKWWWDHFMELGQDMHECDPKGWELVVANVARA